MKTHGHIFGTLASGERSMPPAIGLLIAGGISTVMWGCIAGVFALL